MEPTQPGRFILWENPDKPIPPGVVTRDVDKEDLVKRAIAYGVEPVFTEGDDKVIWVHFLPDDIQPFENQFFSNKEMFFSVRMLIFANEWWRDAMVMWKSKIRYLDKLKHATRATAT